MICSSIGRKGSIGIGGNSRGAGGENSIKARVEPPTSLGKKKGANQEIGAPTACLSILSSTVERGPIILILVPEQIFQYLKDD